MKTILFFLILSISSSYAQTVEQQLEEVGRNRTALESIVDRVPYQTEQHQVIETYFKNLNDLAIELKDYQKSQKRFNNYVAQNGVEAFCKNTFLDKKRWADLQRNCNKNGFFICAEEVRSFNLLKESLKNSLYEDAKKQFMTTESCK